MERSIRENLINEKRLRTLVNKVDNAEFRGEEVLERVGRIRGSSTGTLRAIGRGGGTVLGAVAIISAVSACSAAAEAAWSYGQKMREGDRAFADLDAVDIAVNVQDAGGNYFVTMYALDILLGDE